MAWRRSLKKVQGETIKHKGSDMTIKQKRYLLDRYIMTFYIFQDYKNSFPGQNEPKVIQVKAIKDTMYIRVFIAVKYQTTPLNFNFNQRQVEHLLQLWRAQDGSNANLSTFIELINGKDGTLDTIEQLEATFDTSNDGKYIK